MLEKINYITVHMLLFFSIIVYEYVIYTLKKNDMLALIIFFPSTAST